MCLLASPFFSKIRVAQRVAQWAVVQAVTPKARRVRSRVFAVEDPTRDPAKLDGDGMTRRLGVVPNAGDFGEEIDLAKVGQNIEALEACQPSQQVEGRSHSI